MLAVINLGRIIYLRKKKKKYQKNQNTFSLISSTILVHHKKIQIKLRKKKKHMSFAMAMVLIKAITV